MLYRYAVWCAVCASHDPGRGLSLAPPNSPQRYRLNARYADSVYQLYRYQVGIYTSGKNLEKLPTRDKLRATSILSSSHTDCTFCMTQYEARSTRDRRITRSLQKWAPTKSSISQLCVFLCFCFSNTACQSRGNEWHGITCSTIRYIKLCYRQYYGGP